VPPGLLQRLACDAVLQLVVLDAAGAVVEMRSPARLASGAQRRAIGVRDGGSQPSCCRPVGGKRYVGCGFVCTRLASAVRWITCCMGSQQGKPHAGE
jgi:hypothetical protein